MPPTKIIHVKRAAREATANADAAELKPILIPPDKIRPNPRNPRRKFPQSSLERLAASIEEIGVLVPVTVYRDSRNDTDFVLLDGERRWRASRIINLPKLPAWVIAKPSGADNAVRMFNIHMLRDDWDEMATAWALEQIMEETGKKDDKELQKLTGLSPDRISNMKRVLAFPRNYQELVHDGTVPYNLLVELDKAILTRARQEANPERVKEERVLGRSETELRDMFLKKYEQGVFQDVVDLRKVSALIKAASGSGTTAVRAKKALKKLVTDESATIDDAYDFGAPGSIEVTKVMRDLKHLPSRLGDLLETQIDKQWRRPLIVALRAVRDSCRLVLRKLDESED